MILIALGANLPSPAGSPRETLEAALAALEGEGLRIVARSRWWSTAAVPPSDQPRYVNGVARIEASLDPAALLAALHRIEDRFGRRRGEPGAARSLDLDLLDHDGAVRDGAGGGPVLPHPRLHERAFVLRPLAEVAPGWTHPVTGKTVERLIAELPDQDCRLI